MTAVYLNENGLVFLELVPLWHGYKTSFSLCDVIRHRETEATELGNSQYVYIPCD